ncbi:MAG: peroxiredoxin-like family protein [Sciscionella sp.]
MHQQHTNPRIGLIAIGFSPPEALAELAQHLSWAHPFLSDEHRSLYAALGLGRAALHHVYSPGTLAYYARATLRGEHLARPVEDTRQLGGDAVVKDGVIVRRWRPRSPDDRVAPAALIAAAARHLR